MPARIEIPDVMLGATRPGELSLSSKYDVLRCCSVHGSPCARCVMPLQHKTALKHLKHGSLPQCPAHGLSQQLGCAHAVALLSQMHNTAEIVHQVPVYSEGSKGRGPRGHYKHGSDGRIDLVMPSLCCEGKSLAPEVDGPEHTRARVQKADSKRNGSAATHGHLSVVQLSTTKTDQWAGQLYNAAAWQLVCEAVDAPATSWVRTGL
jgi:hypothetical protein